MVAVPSKVPRLGLGQHHQDVVVFVLEFAGFLGVSLVTV